MARARETAETPTANDPQQKFALLFGAILVAIGLVGFSGYLVNEEGHLLGLFGISPLHNLVHVLTGALGLVLGSYAGGGALFNKVGSVLYLVVFLVGVVALGLGIELVVEPLNLNWADNVLHLGLAVLVGAVGFGIGKARPH